MKMTDKNKKTILKIFTEYIFYDITSPGQKIPVEE